MQEITRNSSLVSATGGQIDYVDRYGDVLMSVSVPSGRVSAADYLDLCPDGCEIQVSDGLVAVLPRSFAIMQVHHMHEESGANPDFEPTSAANQERRLQLLVSRMTAETVEKTVAARMAGLQQVEMIPQAPAPAPDTGGEFVEP